MSTKSFKFPLPSRAGSGFILTRKIQLVLDGTALIVAFCLAYLLRFDFEIPKREALYFLVRLPLVVALQFAVLRATGVYSFVWRYVGISEIRTFARSAIYSILPLLLMRMLLSERYQTFRIPLSIIVTDTVLAFVGTLGLRVLRRIVYEKYEQRSNVAGLLTSRRKKRVLLVGAGRAGVLAAREIQSSGKFDLDIRGFIDDDPAKQGSVIGGVKVLGLTTDLPRFVRDLNIDHVVISIAGATRRDFRRILTICQEVPVKARTIPGLYELLQGDVKVSRIRDLQIEDLLGRAQVEMDEQHLARFLTGKTVMVTGAGGSIGAELARQVTRYKPARLLLLERAEGGLFNIDLELRENWPQQEMLPLMADICDEPRMRSVMSSYRPHVILHAAAHKHVPMMEFNPCEAAEEQHPRHELDWGAGRRVPSGSVRADLH